MIAPRSADEVYAEQVAQAQQAVAQAQAVSTGQLAQAQVWLEAGLPANVSAVTPSPSQLD
jgi:hypothetical protein